MTYSGPLSSVSSFLDIELECFQPCSMPTLVFPSLLPFSWSNLVTNVQSETSHTASPFTSLPPGFHSSASLGVLSTFEPCCNPVPHLDSCSGQEERPSPSTWCAVGPVTWGFCGTGSKLHHSPLPHPPQSTPAHCRAGGHGPPARTLLPPLPMAGTDSQILTFPIG